MPRILSRLTRTPVRRRVGQVATAAAAAFAVTVAAVAGITPPVAPLELVSAGGGSGGLSGPAIWAATWWNGSPEGPGPWTGSAGGAAGICSWHDLGPGLANLDDGLSEASLPLSFWESPDGGGHPGVWGVNRWALALLGQGTPTDHFDLVACTDGDEVPPTSADVEADLPLAYPPKSGPLHVWLFWDTVPDPPSGALPGIIHRAYDKTRVPAPRISTSPSDVGRIADSTVVNLPTWLWVDPHSWRTYSASAAAGGYVATVWAVPISVQWMATWDFASPADDPEGGTTFGPEVLDQICDGPGVAYNPAVTSQRTDCSFDFTQSSFGTHQQLRAAITWDVSWALSDPAGVIGGEGSLGTIVTTGHRRLRVMQVESLISTS